MVEVKQVKNILKVNESSRQEYAFFPSKTIGEYVAMSGYETQDVRIVVNGKVVTNLQAPVYDKTQIILIGTPGEPISATLAIIGAFALAHPFITAAIVLTIASIGMAIGAAMAPKPGKPSVGNLVSVTRGSLEEGSPTYGWDGARTVQSVGIPLAVIYGEHQVAGNKINEYIWTDGDKSYLNCLIAIGEGEIDSISGIKINENPIANFNSCSYTAVYGTNSQSILSNFGDLHNLYDVNVQLLKSADYVYTTVDTDVEAFELRLQLPSGLYLTDETDGAIKSWEVTYQVQYKVHTDLVYTDLGTTTISSRQRTTLRRIFRKVGLTAAQYDIKVTRTSDDSDFYHIGDLYLTQIDEIKTDDLMYPNTALIGFNLLATDQLSGATPNFTMNVKGVKILQPRVMNGVTEVAWADYYWNPTANEYRLLVGDTSLTWNGITYVTKWGANPIWCLYNLLTNTRYGLGNFIDTTAIDLAQFVEMSQYCEEKVPDGSGGYEKRFRMDVVLDSATSALDMVSQLCSTFRCLPFYSQGTIKLKIDKVDTPVQVFGMSNIISDSFTQTWKSIKDTPNVIEVTFNDKDKDYKQETVSIIDEASLAAGDPMRIQQVRLFTTRLSQALREGRFLLHQYKYITRGVAFGAGIDAVAIQPGDLIYLSHDVPQWGDSGRVVSAAIVFEDRFNNDSLDTTIWYTDYYATNGEIVESGGVLNFNNTPSLNSGADLYSFLPQDLTGSAVSLKIIDASRCGVDYTGLGESNDFWHGMYRTHGPSWDGYYFDIIDGSLASSYYISAAGTVLDTRAYNAALHKYLRIREEAGTTYWDYSTDGTTWVNITSTLNKFVLSDLITDPGFYYAATANTVNVQVGEFKWQLLTSVTTVCFDSPIIITAGPAWKIRVRYSDDTLEETFITNSAGSTDHVHVSPALSAIPAAYDVFLAGPTAAVGKEFRILQLSRTNGNEVTMQGIEYNAAIYDDSAVVIPTTNYSLLSREIPMVENLSLTERLVKMPDGTIETSIDVWFSKPSTITTYDVRQYLKAKVYLSHDAGVSWQFRGETTADHFPITGDINDGIEYWVAVVSAANDGSENAITTSPYSTITTVGKSAVPSNVSNFLVNQDRDRLLFGWSEIADLDVWGYEIRKGSSWDTGEIMAFVQGDRWLTTRLKEGLDQSYWIKAIDTSGNYSTTATEAILTIEQVPFKNIVQDYTEEPTWAGEKNGCVIDGVVLAFEDNPVAHYKCNDNAATSAVDDTRDTYEATYKDGAGTKNTSTGTTTGKINAALTMDGSGVHIDCGDVVCFNATHEFSLLGWFKQTTLDQVDYLYNKTLNATNYFAVHTHTNGHLVVCIELAGSYYEGWFDYSTVVTAGVFFHLCVKVDLSKTTDTERIVVKINDSALSLTFVGTAPAIMPDLATASLTIGFSTYSLAGAVDDVRIYDYAISDEQNTAVYNLGTGSEDDIPTGAGSLLASYYGAVRDVGFLATFYIDASAICTISESIAFDTDPLLRFDSDTHRRFTGTEQPLSATLYIRTSEDNITWTDWTVYQHGDYICRYFQIKAVMERATTGTDLTMSSLDYFADLPDVDESDVSEVTDDATGKSILFTKTYHLEPNVHIEVTSGDGIYSKFVSKDTTGFTVKLYNAAGVSKTGDFEWHAHGV